MTNNSECSHKHHIFYVVVEVIHTHTHFLTNDDFPYYFQAESKGETENETTTTTDGCIKKRTSFFSRFGGSGKFDFYADIVNYFFTLNGFSIMMTCFSSVETYPFSLGIFYNDISAIRNVKKEKKSSYVFFLSVFKKYISRFFKGDIACDK